MEADLVRTVRRLKRETAGSCKDLRTGDGRRSRLLFGYGLLCRLLLRFELLLEKLNAALEFFNGGLFLGLSRWRRRAGTRWIVVRGCRAAGSHQRYRQQRRKPKIPSRIPSHTGVIHSSTIPEAAANLSGRARLSGVRGAWNEYPVICICRCSI
jgi:hypothetical protein